MSAEKYLTANTSNRALLILLAVTAGVSVANIIYNQPLLENLKISFPDNPTGIALVPMVTQLGYALGMMLFSPLGDKLDRRFIILIQIIFLVIALIITTIAPTLWVLIASSAAIGVFSTIAQQVVPFAAELSPSEKRGAAVGTVMMGMLLGILLARTFAGFIAYYLGWRAVFATSVFVLIILAAVVYWRLPHSKPTSKLSYPKLLKSMYGLFLSLPALRQASFTGAAIFAAFSAFWPALTLMLASQPFHMGPQIAGLYGIAGVAGALLAPLVGHITDNKGTRFVVTLGLILLAVSFSIIFASRISLLGLAIGVIVLDIGVQSAMVANQSRIYALVPEARSRINTVYMICYFIGGAIGSWAGVAAWHRAEWTGVCVIGFTFVLIAFFFHCFPRSMK